MSDDIVRSAPSPLGRLTETEHLWIPMPDGTRLAARLWLPDAAQTTPAPALFEYIPYRKADMVRARDARNHPYFAAHGMACLRVDMRGSGDSEGHMPDMYTDAELADAHHVIEWIAAQPWCDGQVGMFGTSWGGTAALQANLDPPKALKAIIAVCATHNRYEDDIHHKGGLLITDTFEWGATLPAILAAPPTPNVGPDWKTLWQERLDGLTDPVEAWVREEARGTYWRHGSVIHDAARLTAPILAVGGWSDRYSNSVMSLVSARPDLVWGVVGPWGHHYPDHSHPGPGIGFQKLALEWWQHWFAPEASPPNWPRLRSWLRDYDPPENALDRRQGRWMQSGPPDEVTKKHILHLHPTGLAPHPATAPLTQEVPQDLRVGQAAGDTGYFGRFGGLPLDQSEDDARSLVFETAPLTDDLVLYGAPDLTLQVEKTTPLGQLSVRLVDVPPEGPPARVTFGLRNLALDPILDAPTEPPNPGTATHTMRLPTHAYRFRKNHRLRLSIGTSYWPIAWPSPEVGIVRITQGTLSLPLLKGAPEALDVDLPPVEDLPAQKTHIVRSAPALERKQTQHADGTCVISWAQPFGEIYFPDIDTAFGYATAADHRIHPEDPASAQTHITHHARYTRQDGTADIQSSLTATCDAKTFYVEGALRVAWRGTTQKERQWRYAIPRQFG